MISFFFHQIAAGNMNTVYTMSTLSTSSIEEVAEASPNANKFFQLYIYKDRELTKYLVRRVEKAGFKAIILTVDAPIFGARRLDVKNKFELPQHLRWAIQFFIVCWFFWHHFFFFLFSKSMRLRLIVFFASVNDAD